VQLHKEHGHYILEDGETAVNAQIRAFLQSA